MPRGTPDEEVYTPRVQPEDLPRKLIPRMEPVPVGQAFEQVAEASNRKYQSDSATWAGDQITQARIQAVQSLETAKANAPAGDQTGFTQKYLASFDKDNEELADSAGGNGVAKQMVQKGLTDLRQTLQTHTLGWEAQQNVAYRADSFQNNLKTQLPLVEAHPELAGQVGSTLMDQLNATGAEPAQRLKVAREMDSQISLAAANGLTRKDPRGTLQALNNPTSGLDTSKYKLSAGDPAANSANWDKRADGSDKGQGFLGLLKRPAGKVSSEISIGVEIGGKEVEVPTMVPTLSQKQLDYLMKNPVGEGHPIPQDIVQKATDYARQRIASGKSPFASPGEQIDAGPAPLQSVISGLTDAQREAVRTKANEHLGDAVYSSLERQDIRGAQLALNKNEDLLDPKMAEQLQRTINGQVSSNLALQDKQQRDNSNSLLKNAILMQKNGQLTPQWIEQHHNTWEPEAYEYAYKLLSGKETQTDPHVYAPLLTQALQGQDVSQKAQDALYAGQLTLADYKAIADKSEAPRKGYVARGADYISESLKPNPLVSDPAGARAHANALDDWRQWTDEHPEATENEARSTYRSITDHYQIISADKATVFMPVPLHLVGSRLQPDIIGTWAATKKAHDAGELSEAEYQRQALLIQQWNAAQQKKPQPKATP